MVLDSSTRDYLWEISEVVKQAGGRPADAELIVGNMLAEIAGKEAEVLLDVRAGQFVESLLPLFAVPGDVARLVEALAQAPRATIVDVFANPSSSHVFEHLLQRAMTGLPVPPNFADEDDGNNQDAKKEGRNAPNSSAATDAAAATSPATEKEEQEWALLWRSLECVAGAVAGASWAEAACDANACHAVRTLMALLARGAACTAPGRGQSSARAGLLSAAGGLAGALCANARAAALDAHAGPTLAVAVSSVAAVARARPAAGVAPCAALLVARVVDALQADNAFGDAARNAVGSRLLEALVRAVPRSAAALQTALYTRAFAGPVLVSLARDRAGNHVVQALLAAPGVAPTHIGAAVRALLPDLAALCAAPDRAGVVVRAAEACARCAVCEDEFASALQCALAASRSDAKVAASKNKNKETKEGEENSKTTTPKLTGAEFASAVLGDTPRPAYLRSRLAQALLRMGKGVARGFGAGLAALPGSFLAQLAGSAAGSHVVEAALRCRALPQSVHEKLIARLRGSLAALARSAQGSRVVELCYARAAPETKAALVAELAAHEPVLAADRFGRYVLRTCRVALYRGKPDAWRAQVLSAQSTRALFREFLDDADTNTPNGAAATEEAAAAMDGDDEEVMPGGKDAFVKTLEMNDEVQKRVLELAGSSASGKAKRKKPKKPKKAAEGTAEQDKGTSDTTVDAAAAAETEELRNSIVDALRKAGGQAEGKKSKKSRKRDREEETTTGEGEGEAKKARSENNDNDSA